MAEEKKVFRVIDSPTSPKVLEDALNGFVTENGSDWNIDCTIQYDKHGVGPHVMVVQSQMQDIPPEPEPESETENEDATGDDSDDPGPSDDAIEV